MSAHVEWMRAADVSAEVFAPGEDWVGADDQDATMYVLTLSTDDVIAIEGSPADLLALVLRLGDRLVALPAQLPLPAAARLTTLDDAPNDDPDDDPYGAPGVARSAVPSPATHHEEMRGDAER